MPSEVMRCPSGEECRNIIRQVRVQVQGELWETGEEQMWGERVSRTWLQVEALGG